MSFWLVAAGWLAVDLGWLAGLHLLILLIAAGRSAWHGMAPLHAEMVAVLVAILVADTSDMSLYGCLKPSHCPVSAAVIHKQAAGAWSGRVMRTRATLPGWTQPCLC